ncbi:hypothetical protein CPC16_006505, partial [Podila verticillata]
LIAHGIHHLEHVDQIIVIKDGGITENGHCDSLMDTKGAFRQLIDKYSVNARKEKKKSAEASSSLTKDRAMSEVENGEVESLDTVDGSGKESGEENGKKIDRLVQDEKMKSGSVALNV